MILSFWFENQVKIQTQTFQKSLESSILLNNIHSQPIFLWYNANREDLSIKNRRGVTKIAVVSLENNIKLYSSELFHALLKASNYKLDERIAQTVAEGYARNLDYSDPELMHVGVTSVANNLLTKIKQEYFNV